MAKDLAKETFFDHNRNYKGSYLVENFFRPVNTEPLKVIHIQLTDAVIEMVKAGLGITIMNRWALKNYFGDKSLRFLSLTKNGFYRGGVLQQ